MRFSDIFALPVAHRAIRTRSASPILCRRLCRTRDPVNACKSLVFAALYGVALHSPHCGIVLRWYSAFAVFGGEYLREQRRGGEAIGDRSRRRRMLMDTVTGSTAVSGPVDLKDPELRRHPVEHFAHRVFDEVQGTAAVSAGRLIDPKRYFLARQMRRQRFSMRKFFNAPDMRRHLGTRKGGAEIGVQVLKAKGELIGAELSFSERAPN